MHNEMMGALVRRAIEHPDFRQHLLSNPREALQAHGFALEQEDLRQVEAMTASYRGRGDEEVEKALYGLAERFGVEVKTDRG